MRELKWSGALLCALVVAACGDDSRPVIRDAGPGDDDGGNRDGGPPRDGGGNPDGGGVDAGDLCATVDCSGMDDMCNMGVCDPATGTCGTEPRTDGTACDDGDTCTSTDVCTAGTCGGTDVDCSGMTNMCNVGVCDPTSGACVAMPVMDGTTCDDGAACTMGDVCTAGACAGAMIDCSGFGDDCNTGVCDPATGTCGRMPAVDGTACDDGDLCTSTDSCTAGACGGTLTDCSGSGDMCNTGMCDPTSGACVSTPLPDGTACDDANACTAMDACGMGTCSGASLVPGSDTCAGAIAIPLPAPGGTTTLTGSNECGTNDYTGSCAGSGLDVIYSFTLTTTQRVTATTINVGGAFNDTVLYIRGTCDDTASEVACNDDASGLFSRVDRVLTAGTYFLVVDGFNSGDVGNYQVDFTVADVPAPDTCMAAISLPFPTATRPTVATGSTTGGANDFSGTCGAGTSPDHVYSLVVPAASRLRFSTAGSGFDTVLSLFNSPCGTGTLVQCNDDAIGVQSQFEAMVPAGTYFVVVDGFSSGRQGAYTLTISQVASDPVTFTTCGATGRDGPTAAACTAAYTGTPLAGAVTVTGGIQSWTVPTTRTYRIEAFGAQGASATAMFNGGLGARMRGDFMLTAGTVLQVLVGQRGSGGASMSNGGGGGGSFVVQGMTPLIVAGGGGGTRTDATRNGFDAVTGNDGAGGNVSADGATGTAVAGGVGGGGGNISVSWGSGGGGFTGNGVDDSPWGTGGRSFTGGGQGGGAGSSPCGDAAFGGFGGGGSGSGCFGGGGGGGYSGGAGAWVAGGGGSFNSGTAQDNSAGANSGDGRVVITPL
jgi:hypothetical protein